MDEFQAGEVVVPVVPDATGFHKALRKTLLPGAYKLGQDIGQQMQRGIKDSLHGVYEPLREETQRQKSQAPKGGDQVGGAFAAGFKKRIQAAFKTLPKAEIDADSNPAQVKIQQIRQSLQQLSDRTVGVDIDAAAAVGELRALQNELRAVSRDATVDVRADTAAAMAQLSALNGEIARVDGTLAVIDVDADTGAASAALAATDAEVSRLDGRTANVRVNADVSQALAAIASVGAAMAALSAIPVGATLGAGIAGLAGPLSAATAGAGAFAAVALPGFKSVSEAVKEADKATRSAGGSAGGAAKQVKDLAIEQTKAKIQALQAAGAQDQLKAALDRVKTASAGVTSARQRLADVEASVASRVQSALAQVARAELAVADAQRSAQRAQEDLNRARVDAARAIEDLGSRLAGSQLDLREANLDLADAQRNLDKVNANGKATSQDRERAAIAYERAQLRVQDLTTQIGRLQQEQADADKKGVEGSDLVVAAKDRVEEAARRVAEAERAVADARAAADRAASDGSKQIAAAKAQVKAAEQQVIAAKKAVEAQKRQIEISKLQLKLSKLQEAAAARAAKGGGGGGGGGSATPKMDKLSKSAKDLAKDLVSFQKAYKDWQETLQPEVFPVISQGLDLIKSNLSKLDPFVKGAAKGFSTLISDAKTALNNPFWTGFAKELSAQVEPAITGLGRSFGNVITGIAGVIRAFLPFTPTIVGGLEQVTAKFSAWGQNLRNSTEFKDFIAFVRANAPAVWEFLGNIAGALVKVVQGLAPLGVGAFAGLSHLADVINGMSAEQIQAIATGIGLVFAAIKAGQSLKILVLVGAAEALARMNPTQIYAVAGAVTALVTAFKIKGVLDDLGLLKTKVADVGTAASVAGVKITTLLKGGGIAALATGAAAGVDKFSDSLQGLNPDINALAAGIGKFVQTGKLTPELLDQIGAKTATLGGSHLETFADTAARLASDNPFDKIGNSVKGFVDELAGGLVTVDNGKQSIGNLDQALAQLATSGHGDQAAKAFAVLQRTAQDAGVPVDKLKTLFPLYSSAVQAAAGPTGTVGQAAATAAGQLKQLTDKLSGVGAANASAITAEISYKDAVDKATAAVREHGKGLDTNTQKGRDNLAALVDLAGKANTYRRALIDQGEPISRVNQLMKDQRQAFIETALKMGATKKEAEQYADKLGLIPKSVSTKITLDIKQAQSTWDAFRAKLTAFTVKIPVSIAAPKANGGVFGLAGGGVVERYARGGVRPPANIATSPTILYGEAGPEAFIPLARSKRPRGLEVLSQAAAIMGQRVVPMASGGFTALSPTGSAGAGFVDPTGFAGLGARLGLLNASVGKLNRTSSQILAEAKKTVAAQAAAKVTSSQMLAAIKSASASKPSRGKGLTSSQMLASVTDALTTLVEDHVIPGLASGGPLQKFSVKWPGSSFDSGGFSVPGGSLVHNGTGQPERILTEQQWNAMMGNGGGRGDAPLVQIDNFSATPEQSPYGIALEMRRLLGSQLRSR